MRVLFGLFAALVLASCQPVSVDLYQSQRRMEDEIARRIAAETAALAEARGQSAAGTLGGPGKPPAASVASARAALAQDAQADYRRATAGAVQGMSDADRISLLTTAGQKALYAGRAARPGLATGIRDAGAPLCDRMGASRPRRDCDLIAVLPYLTGLMAGRDVIFDARLDYDLRRRGGGASLPVADVGAIAGAVVDMNDLATALIGQVAEIAPRPDIADFVRTWQRDFWCSAARGMDLMGRGEAPGGIGLEAARLAAGTGTPPPSADLAAALSTAKVSPDRLPGSYRAYSQAIGRAYGLPGNQSPTASFRGHARACGDG